MSNNGPRKSNSLPPSPSVTWRRTIEDSPIEIIKKLMTNGVMATINQSVDFDTAAIVVGRIRL